MIKLFAADLDGTLLRSDKSISPRTMHALHAAQERGVLLVPATGRLYRSLPEALLDEQLSRHVRHGGDTSLNYLAANTLKAAGLPLNEYFAFLYATKQSLPAINLNGYMDAEGVWHWNDDADSSSAEAVADLAIVQHQNLFDNKQ